MKIVIARPGRYSSTDAMTYSKLRREGIEVIVATELGSTQEVAGVEALHFKHPDEIFDLEPDLVDVPDIHYALSQYVARHLPPTTKLVCTAFDNLPGKNWGDPMAHARHVDLWVARSKLIENTLWWDGVPAEKIRVVNPGVDTFVFEQLSFVPKSNAVLFVGRLIAYKGLKDVIIALKGLGAELWVVGEGDDQEQYTAWAGTLGVPIKFLGRIPHGPALAQIYREAQVFCAPSFPVDSWDVYGAWAAQWGSAEMEAMACGLPVVTTDTGSFPEFIQDGYNGFTVPARNWYALHQRLGKLLGDSTLRESMGANARKSMKQKYSSQIIGDQLAELYREVVDGED